MNAEVSGFSVPLTKLPRRPGNMWETDRDFDVPSDMGVALAQIDPESKIAADIRLESVLEGVLVSAELNYHVQAECSRCLEPLEWDDTAQVMELFLYPETDSRGREITGRHGGRLVHSDLSDMGSDADPDKDTDSQTSYVQNDAVDLEEVIRDAIVLELPLRPLCDPGCEGLCPTCGEKIAGGPHQHEVLDPRWAALEALQEGRPPVSE